MKPRKTTFEERAAALKARLTGNSGTQAEKAEFDEVLLEKISQRASQIVLDALQEEPEWVRTEKAAAHLGITETALNQRKWANQFPPECFRKIGASLWWDLRALD